MRAEVLTPDELTRKDIDSFWNQNVCMDDWDYIVLAPEKSIEQCEGAEGLEYNPTEYTLERILVGCCSNRWYSAMFRGKKYAVGVAYHA